MIQAINYLALLRKSDTLYVIKATKTMVRLILMVLTLQTYLKNFFITLEPLEVLKQKLRLVHKIS